ncbi:MAG: 30S ribosomal protein S1 [Clostridia bacterium]|nr:30S ribosomal protein S1 [Clostridia bacterium]MBQ8338900.1 30S ribosomal protein S1 [Clostridia bacterium]
MNYLYKPEGMLEKTPENKEALSSPAALQAAMRAGKILEAPVLLCDSNMRLHVDLGCMRGIIEREEAVYCRPGEVVKDIAVITRVGKTVAFKILRFAKEDGETVAMLSRRAAQDACIAEYLSELLPGDIIPVRVTHLENYGAFVDIGCGISSLLSIDCISVSRISHPRDRLACGMYLWVAVKSIDREMKRIFVTLKELLGTWEENAAGFAQGETVVGRVRSIESYGIFVELTPNLAGLAELRSSNNVPIHTAVGDLAAVFIKSILPERMKIKLVIIDSYAADVRPEVPKYYIDVAHTHHMDYWEYSPACSTRLIETIF